MRPEHNPIQDPCVLCGCRAIEHRVPHRAEGDPCVKCNLPAICHVAKNEEQQAAVNAARPAVVAKENRKRDKSDSGPILYLGLDGEGQGRKPHRYVYLAAGSFDGQSWSVEDPNWRASWNGERYDESLLAGLSTIACLDFILSLPPSGRIFAFAFGYDLTKILEDVDDATLWLLLRPEERPRKGKLAGKLGPRPVLWMGYKLNLQGTHFTVERDGIKREVWDLFKFYGCKFTSALADWKIGSDELRQQIEDMKAKRGDFDKEDPASVSGYCKKECSCLAEMAKKLIDAHDAVELPLKVFHGPGSSAGVMLKKMGIKDALRAPPEGMTVPVAQAFFGGRFENSVIGPVEEELDAWDISSAYPYQTFQLPCLVHGEWTHTKKRKDLEGRTAALIRYSLGLVSHRSDSPLAAGAWGPFPFRFPKGHEEQGSICFPRMSGGGWVYLAEYLEGEKFFPEVQFEEAWVYEKKCDCQPFKDIPYYYLYRIVLGKEGPGLTIKLAVNSCYGKLAQSIGHAVFNSWLWAGMITSGCRAQALALMGMHKDYSNLLMIATDGIVTKERLRPAKPIDTGTFELLPNSPPDAFDKNGKNKKPLGGWEQKKMPNGMFFARPGIYFPLHMGDLSNEENKKEIEKAMKEIKGRGVGKAVLMRHYNDILRAWVFHKGTETITVTKVARFCGAKTSIHRSGKKPDFRFTRADGNQKSEHGKPPTYGQWIERPVQMSFDPLPKRAGIADDKSLILRDLPTTFQSAPYDRVVISKEAAELRAYADIIAEQADLDLRDFPEMMEEMDL